jgi:hypothetical protein
MNIKTIYLFLIVLISNIVLAQNFTRQDSLRGSITKERVWWDLKKYHLDIKVNPADSTIAGSNTIDYQVLDQYNVMQIDLQEPMQITKIVQDGINLKFQRDGNVFHVFLAANQIKGDNKKLVAKKENPNKKCPILSSVLRKLAILPGNSDLKPSIFS